MSRTGRTMGVTEPEIPPWYRAIPDMSSFIKAVFMAGRRLLITAPSQFGKTHNLRLLRDFLKIGNTAHTPEFKDSQIYCRDSIFFNDNFGKHPVLFLNFGPNYVPYYEGALENYRGAIHSAFVAHRHVIQKDKLNFGEQDLYNNWCDYKICKNFTKQHITHDLVHLVRMMKRSCERNVVVLIDEYDGTVNDSLTNNNIIVNDIELKEIMDLTESILKNLLKGNKDVSIAVLTGVSSVVTKGLSEVDNMRIFPFTETHEFNDFFGFTEMDVQKICTKHNQYEKKKIHLLDRKRYLNRYKNQKTIYNPHLLIKSVESHKFQFAFEHARSIKHVIRAIEHYPEVLLTIDTIFRRKPVTFKFTSKPLLQDLIDLNNSVFRFPTIELWEINLDLMLSYLLENGLFSRRTYSKAVDDDEQTIDDDARINDDDTDDGERISIKMPDEQLLEKLAREFQKQIVNLCGVPRECLSTCHTTFISNMNKTQNTVWKKLVYKMDKPEKPPSTMEKFFMRFRR